jgi:hypothetical protein
VQATNTSLLGQRLTRRASVAHQDRGQLQVAIVDSCNREGLQPVPAFVQKVLQLYETFNVRFGVMLVGPTGGGKTQCYRMLQSASTHLKQAGSSLHQVLRLHMHIRAQPWLQHAIQHLHTLHLLQLLTLLLRV